MSNKKHVFLLLIPLMLIGCASSSKVAYHVSQSAWVNASIGEVDNISASVVTTLLFTSDKDVTVMSSVKKNAETIVKPFVYAKGTYKIDGNPRKTASIVLNVKTIDGKDLVLEGQYSKTEAMLLKSKDGEVRLFAYVNKLNVK